MPAPWRAPHAGGPRQVATPALARLCRDASQPQAKRKKVVPGKRRARGEVAPARASQRSMPRPNYNLDTLWADQR